MQMSFRNVKHIMPAMRLYDSFIICLALLNLIDEIHCEACNTAEYKIDEECCPMCPAGRSVLNHCDNTSGTKCKVCIGSTYTDVPNGLTTCLSCRVCDKGNGLMVKSKCRSDSDALCEPLPGYYCVETQNESCRKAREHSSCLPGQYIYQTGTALTDTVCKDCSEGTYSNGSLIQCRPHTNCESVGQIQVTQGTWSSDAVCSHKPSQLGLIIRIVLSLLFLGVILLCVLLWRKHLLCCRNTLY